MIDPLTSLGVAANVIQVVDFGFRILARGKDLLQHGNTKEQEHLRLLAKDIKHTCRELEHQLAASDAPSEESSILDLANRTKDAADQLEDLLSSLSLTNKQKSSKTQRTFQAAKYALKGVWKEQDVARLKRQMSDLQQDMLLRMVALQTTSLSTLLRSTGTRARPSARADILLEVNQREMRLAKYEKLLPDLDRYILISTPGTEGKNDVPDVDSLSATLHEYANQVRTIAFCQRILESLSFEEIYRRHDTIAAAHKKTFEWMFDREMTSFSDWASCKSGTFWITGKPGSGKSTLMKYLVNHQSTQDLLRQWAGEDELLVASYFFWTAGSTMQKSQEGLLRTLLFHIIQQSPEQALELVPGRFKTDLLTKLPWTYEELRTTIMGFARHGASKVKLCLFIDGLDEYVGEHVDLVELIGSISDNPQIKVCVASRPWNVFSRAYKEHSDGHLAVQDLTKADITTYVTEKLGQSALFRSLESAQSEACQQLIEDLSTKAQGVFLWVYLVLRSMLRGLDNDDDLHILQRRLNDYPPTLDDYFQRMFDRIEGVYLKHSARILLATYHRGSPLLVWEPRCLEIEIDDPDYCLRIHAPPSSNDVVRFYGCNHCDLNLSASGGIEAHCKVSEGRAANCKFMEGYMRLSSPLRLQEDQRQRVQRLLDARTADMLELDMYGDIDFVHRTARDFIADNDILVELDHRAQADFDIGLSLARLQLVWEKRATTTNTLPDIRRLDYTNRIKEENLEAYSGLFHDFEATVVPAVERTPLGLAANAAWWQHKSWVPKRVEEFRRTQKTRSIGSFFASLTLFWRNDK